MMSAIFGRAEALLCSSVQAKIGTQIHLRPLSSILNKKNNGETSPARVRQQDLVIKEPIVIEPIKQELIKRVSVDFHGVAPTHFNDQSEWFPIFRSPYIATIRRIIRFKVYLTAFSFTSSLAYVYQLLMDGPANPWKPLILSSLTLAGLVFIGDFARRLIVQIYVSKDLDYVRFCRFTFLGKRRDMVVARDAIIRLPEINTTPRKPILDVRFNIPERGIDLDHDHYEFYELGFRIPIALGGVIDKDKFNEALGKILVDKR